MTLLDGLDTLRSATLEDDGSQVRSLMFDLINTPAGDEIVNLDELGPARQWN